jgi:hypothetical protein
VLTQTEKSGDVTGTSSKPVVEETITLTMPKSEAGKIKKLIGMTRGTILVDVWEVLSLLDIDSVGGFDWKNGALEFVGDEVSPC